MNRNLNICYGCFVELVGLVVSVFASHAGSCWLMSRLGHSKDHYMTIIRPLNEWYKLSPCVAQLSNKPCSVWNCL